MAETHQADATQSPWLLGLMFAALLPVAVIVIGAIAALLSPALARVLVPVVFAAILLAAGAVAARRGASAPLVGAIAAGFAALIIALIQLFRIAIVFWGNRFIEDASVSTNRFLNTLYALLLVVVAVAIGALLGWIGARLAGRRAA